MNKDEEKLITRQKIRKTTASTADIKTATTIYSWFLVICDSNAM